MNNVTVLVGAQWGDEGKGKWVDILAKDAHVVARYQGGNNAGHTLYINGERIVLHQIPSGIFQPSKTCALTSGVVINPSEFVKEMQKVRQFAELTPNKLWLSARAHVISPWSIYRDSRNEQRSDKPIGTTKRGIGPTYADKAARTGLRLGDYCVASRRQAWIQSNLKNDELFCECYEELTEAWRAFEEAAAVLEPFVCDAELRIRQALNRHETLILEGAQGALLDIDHGTYPYVTSSATASGGAFASLGFSPRLIHHVYGISKAYVTRVGEGAMPTELNDAAGKHMAKTGNEFGATTGRPRRCGWLDIVALRHARDVNGFDSVILNKLDVLSGLEELKICIAYQHPLLGRIEHFPWDHNVLQECTPIYETYSGWKRDLAGLNQQSQLPSEAIQYIKAVAASLECRISYVGTGVNRHDFIEITDA